MFRYTRASSGTRPGGSSGSNAAAHHRHRLLGSRGQRLGRRIFRRPRLDHRSINPGSAQYETRDHDSRIARSERLEFAIECTDSSRGATRTSFGCLNGRFHTGTEKNIDTIWVLLRSTRQRRSRDVVQPIDAKIVSCRWQNSLETHSQRSSETGGTAKTILISHTQVVINSSGKCKVRFVYGENTSQLFSRTLTRVMPVLKQSNAN